MEVLQQSLQRFGPQVYLTTAYDDHCVSRIMMLNYHPRDSFFFCVTRNISNKYRELKANPNACWSWYDEKTRDQVVAQVTVDVREDAETKQSCWNDSFHQFGYKGNDDPIMVILKFTVNKVVQHFLGKPPVVSVVAPKTAAAYVNAPKPTRNLNVTVDGDRAMTVLREAYGKNPMVLMCGRDGVDVSTRFMMLRYKDGVGFYGLTYANSSKVAQMQENPRASLQWYLPAEGMKQIVAQVVVTPYQTPEQRRLIWSDDVRQFGFQGPDDANLTVLRMAVTQVDIGMMGQPSQTLMCPPSPYDRYLAAMEEAFAQAPTFLLVTHAPEGRISGRMMLVRYSPALGYYMLTHANSPKVAQIQASDKITIVWNGDKPAPTQLQVKARAFLHVRDPHRQHVWNAEQLTKVGFTGPDDEGLVIIRFVPTEATRTVFMKPEEELLRL
eukprot:GAFH01001468.1.p1 GENE.GAFH01001468.1~~GAFH01001468.1.p1  ORF type:complete len:439 (-),score=169.14 GAFH01001468.1:107-1423(-)